MKEYKGFTIYTYVLDVYVFPHDHSYILLKNDTLMLVANKSFGTDATDATDALNAAIKLIDAFHYSFLNKTEI